MTLDTVQLGMITENLYREVGKKFPSCNKDQRVFCVFVNKFAHTFLTSGKQSTLTLKVRLMRQRSKKCHNTNSSRKAEADTLWSSKLLKFSG